MEVFIEINHNGEKIITVDKNGKKYCLNSKYNTEEFIEIWCKQYDISNPFSIAVVFGISDGRYINKLHQLNEDMLIVVYEPSMEIALNCKSLHIIDDIEDDKLITLVGEESLIVFSHTVGNAIDYANFKYVNFYVSPNYEKLFEKELKSIREMVFGEIRKIEMSHATVKQLGKNFNINKSKNIVDRVNQYALVDLVKKIKNVNLKGIPAVIVAAGPSLDKNIYELKKAKGKALIIAVDTALNSLAKADIIPDICVTIDPIKPVELLSHEKMRNIPLIYHLVSNYKICDVHRGKRFYQDSDESIYDFFIEIFNKERMYLESGGSVANDACSLACFCGFKTIIFIGLDLAYPNDKEHSDDSYGSDHNNIINSNDNKYFYVEDIDGNKVKTEYNMNMYRLWFENEAKIHSEIRFIDATEGGAKINGMDIMTLKDAINENCNCEYVNFEKIIDDVNTQFSNEEQVKILKYLADYDNKIKEIRKKLYEGITLYNKLDEFNRKHKYSGKNFEKVYEKISEINKWITNNKEVAYMNNYVIDRKYEVLEHVYEMHNSVYEDIKFLTDNGKQSLETLIKATYTILDDYKESIEKAKEMLKEYEGV